MRAKETIKKGLKLWAAKKGLKYTGSLLKMGAIAGTGYFAYHYFRKHKKQSK